MRMTKTPIKSLFPRVETIYTASRAIIGAAVFLWLLTSRDAGLQRPELFYGVGIYVVLTSLMHLLGLRRPQITPSILAASLTFDAFFVTYLIEFTGGPHSTFYLLYYLVIMLSAYYYSLNTGIGVSFGITTLYLLTNPGLLTELSPAELGLRLVFAWFFAFVVGYVAGYIKRSEKRLLSLLNTLNESTTELERSQVRVETIYETSRTLGEIHHEQEITNEVLNIVEVILGYEMCSIMILAPDGSRLREIARLQDERRLRHRQPRQIEPAGLLVQVLESGSPRRIIDLESSDGYIPLMKDARSGLIVPMISQGRVIGILNTESTRVNQYTEMDQKVFSILASEAAMAYENSRLHQELENLVIIDELTGAYNFRYFNEKLAEEKRRAARYQQLLSLIMVDIDWFKHCNDTYGHEAGNTVLKGVANVIKGSIRDTDSLARYGGEEFIIILPQTNHEDALHIAERIRSQVESTAFGLKNSEQDIIVTVSVGITTYPDNGGDQDQLVNMVDRAMYLAKGQGKNRVATV